MPNILRFLSGRPAAIAAGGLMLYTLTGILAVPLLIEHYLPTALGRKLDSRVLLGQVRIDPFAFSLEARRFALEEPSGRPMFAFQRLYVNFQLSSLFRRAWTFAQVALEGASLNLVIGPDGTLNWARLARGRPAPPAQPPPAAKGMPRLLVHEIRIHGGRIDIADLRQSTPARVSLSPVDLRLDDLATLPQHQGTYSLGAAIAGGGTLQWSGQFSLNPVVSDGRFSIKGLPLTTPWKFARDQLNLAIPAGRLSLESRYHLDLGKRSPQLILSGFEARLADLELRLRETSAPFLALARTTLEGGRLDLARHAVQVDRLALAAGDLRMVKNEQGGLNLQRIAGRDTDVGSSDPPPAPADGGQRPWTIHVSRGGVDHVGVTYEDLSRTPAVSYGVGAVHLAFETHVSTGGSPGRFRLDHLGAHLEEIAVGVLQASPPALRIGGLKVTDGALDLDKHAITADSIQLRDGNVEVIRLMDNTINLARLFAGRERGAADPAPEPPTEEEASWRVAVDSASLSNFSSRFSDMTVAPEGPLVELKKMDLAIDGFDGQTPSPFKMNLEVVQGGRLAASGSLDPRGLALAADLKLEGLALPILQPYLAQVMALTLRSGRLSSQGRLRQIPPGRIGYQGQIEVTDLDLFENSTHETLLGWRRLFTGNIRFGLHPDQLEIDHLSLTRPRGKLLITQDGKVNVAQSIIRGPRVSSAVETSPKAGDAPPPAFPFRIAKLSLDHGELDFTDLSLTSQFGTRIHELEGQVVGISSTPGARATVQLDGRVDNYGTARIAGEINSFDPKAFTDINMAFRNVEMTRLTPYSGRFAGRRINAGKLSLDLQYKVQEGRLLGDNQIVVDRLVLGDKVASPDAVNLPLDFAVALLADANGVIDIGLPVRGDLNNPEFRLGPLIWKAFVNLMTKIVTSPFRALAALFGGGAEETLDAVAFEAGASRVTPPEREKLDKLLGALRQRPQLKLLVTGRYHEEIDARAFKALQVRRVLAEGASTAPQSGNDPGPLDFSNPDIQRELGVMLIDRYGYETFEAVMNEMAGTAKRSPRLPDSPPALKSSPPDPGRVAKRLYAELVAREPLARDVLIQLAEMRTRAVIQVLSGPQGIAPERVVAQAPQAMRGSGAVSVRLNLDVMTTNPQ